MGIGNDKRGPGSLPRFTHKADLENRLSADVEKFLKNGGTIDVAAKPVMIQPTRKELRDFEKSRRWKNLRKEFILENTHITHCEDCGDPFPPWIEGDSFSKNDHGRAVDHIFPKSKDFSRAHDKTNLRLLCHDCNMEKGDLTLEQIEMAKVPPSFSDLGHYRRGYSLVLSRMTREEREPFLDEWLGFGTGVRKFTGLFKNEYIVLRFLGKIESCLFTDD